MAALKPAPAADHSATVTLTIQSASLSAAQLLARARKALSQQPDVRVVSATAAKVPKAEAAASAALELLDRIGSRAKAAGRRASQREIDAAVARVRAEQYANGHHAPDAANETSRHP